MTNYTNQTKTKVHLALMLSASLATAAFLSGCGRNSGNSQSSSASDSVSQQTADSEPAAAPTAPSAEHGKQLFATACATCHGPQGKGLPHLGKDLQTSKFAAGLSDAQLVAFITHGRSTSNPLNTTHVAMPPKGGNPALSSQDIADIVAYIRELQKHSAPDHPVNTTEFKKKPSAFE